MAHLRVITARRSHIPAIIELWKEFMDFHAALDPFYARRRHAHIGYGQHVMKSIGSRTKKLFAALDGEKIIGYAYAEIAKYPPVFAVRRFGYISDLYVDPAYRRRGAGRMLFAAVKDWFTGRGIQRIELGVASVNKTAASFWRKIGFAERMRRLSMKI